MSEFKIVGGAFEPHSEKGKGTTEIILPPERTGSMKYSSKEMENGGMTIVTILTPPMIAAKLQQLREEGKTEIISPATKGRDEDR